MNEITEKSKVIAEYLGWRYIPFNDLQGFPKAGWWQVEEREKTSVTLDSGEVVNTIGVGDVMNRKQGWQIIDNSYVKFVCRNHSQLRFYNSFDALIPAIEKLEKEDLSDYCYKWKDGRGLNNNFVYVEFMRFRDNSFIAIEWELDPFTTIGKNEGKGIIKDTFYAVYQAIKYINDLKKNYEN